VRVDDPSALPLSNTATATPNDTVFGIDFSGGMGSVIAQINAAFAGTGMTASNPAGTTLEVLDDGAANTVDVNSVSTTSTVTGTAGGTAELPLFTDGSTLYTGAITARGSQSVGLAGRLGVNPAVAAIRPATAAATVSSINHDVGWILLAFFIFNTYMLVLSTQVNLAVFLVFLTLGVTEIILSIGNFNAGAALLPTGTIKFGGYVGILTAIVAWYASFALASRGMTGKLKLPVGPALIR